MSEANKEDVIMRRPDGITFIAIWHFIIAGLCVLGLCGMTFPFMGLWFGAWGDFEGILFGTLSLMFGVVMIIVGCGAFAIVGWGLWRLKSWSRTGAIALAILQLLCILFFPFSTIAGALTLWYLISHADAKAAFQIA